MEPEEAFKETKKLCRSKRFKQNILHIESLTLKTFRKTQNLNRARDFLGICYSPLKRWNGTFLMLEHLNRLNRSYRDSNLDTIVANPRQEDAS